MDRGLQEVAAPRPLSGGNNNGHGAGAARGGAGAPGPAAHTHPQIPKGVPAPPLASIPRGPGCHRGDPKLTSPSRCPHPALHIGEWGRAHTPSRGTAPHHGFGSRVWGFRSRHLPGGTAPSPCAETDKGRHQRVLHVGQASPRGRGRGSRGRRGGQGPLRGIFPKMSTRRHQEGSPGWHLRPCPLRPAPQPCVGLLVLVPLPGWGCSRLHGRRGEQDHICPLG